MKNLLIQAAEKWGRIAFLTVLFGAMLLGNFFTRGQMALLTLAAAPWTAVMLVLYRKRFRADPAWTLLLAGTAWLVLSAVLNGSAGGAQILGLLVAAAYALVAGAPGENMDLRGQRREIGAVAALLVACITPFMLIGVSTVFTGKTFWFFNENIPLGIRSDGEIGFRIWVFRHPNITARGAVLASLLAAYGICVARRRWLKALLGACIAVLALVHTQSRTCFIAFGAAAGAMVFRCLWLRLPERAWRIPAALAAWAAAALAVLAGLNLLYALDIRIADALQPAVQAAGGGVPRAVTEGAFNVFNNGRDRIWSYAWEYLCNHPSLFLTGMGTGDIIPAIAAEIPEAAPFNHLHNSLIESLVRGGVPYLACMLGYLCMLVRPAVGLLTAKESGDSRGLFLMPVLVGTLLVMSLTESMLFADVCLTNGIFFFACGHTLRGWRMRKKETK